MQETDNLAEAKTARPLDVFSNLTPDQQTDFAQDMLDQVKTPARKEQVAMSVMQSLTPEQQKDVAQSLNLIPQPTQRMADYLWAITITSFAVVLLGVSIAVIIGVIWMGKTADNVQPVLTIFTAVIGFLGGLFVKSPIDSSNKTP